MLEQSQHMSATATESASFPHVAADTGTAALAPASSTKRDEPQCFICHLRGVCLPGSMEDSELHRLAALELTRRKVKAGQTLYQGGDEFRHIHVVRTGTLKSSLVLADGREQVIGFHVAGELLGLDGLADGLHTSAAMALEDTETCAIPSAHFSELMAASGGMLRNIARLMSREILRDHSQILLLGSLNAEERLAAFLLDLSERHAARGYSALEFQLRMSRADIGSYLGIKLETVSRTFSAFQQQGLLQVCWRRVRIIDLDGLKRRFDARIPAINRRSPRKARMEEARSAECRRA
jgi:CRP/FNR family transcriptional regulator, anaerobic regulatory protein